MMLLIKMDFFCWFDDIDALGRTHSHTDTQTHEIRKEATKLFFLMELLRSRRRRTCKGGLC